MNILQFSQYYFTERVSEHLQPRAQSNSLTLGLLIVLDLTASHFSSMVITNVQLPWEQELPCLYLSECFLNTFMLVLLSFFCTFFFKRKVIHKIEFWLMSFVWGFIPQYLNTHNDVTSVSVYSLQFPEPTGSVIIEKDRICPFMKEYLCLGQRICEFKTLRSTFWFSSNYLCLLRLPIDISISVKHQSLWLLKLHPPSHSGLNLFALTCINTHTHLLSDIRLKVGEMGKTGKCWKPYSSPVLPQP